MDAEFTQKGYEAGYGKIILTVEDYEERPAKDDAIIVEQSVASGEEYIANKGGQWSTKKETLLAEGTLCDEGISFDLHPPYVDCLKKGLFRVYLVGSDGTVKGDADLSISGVKKSPLGVSGYTLADDSGERKQDAGENDFAQFTALITKAKDALVAAKSELSRGSKGFSFVQQCVVSRNFDDVPNHLQDANAFVQRAKDKKESAAAFLREADALMKNTGIIKDAVKAQEAAALLQQEQNSLDALEAACVQQESKAVQLQEDVLHAKRVIEEESRQEEARRLEEEAKLLAQKVQRQEEAKRQEQDRPKKKTLAYIAAAIVVLAMLAAGGFYWMQKKDPPKEVSAVPEPLENSEIAENKADPVASAAQEIADKVEQEDPTPKESVEENAQENQTENNERANAKKRVGAFFASQNPTAEGAMQLADDLDANTPEQQDALFRLYYYAAEQGNLDGALRMAECIDPAKPQWGSIKKDAAEAWYYYGKHPNGSDNREKMKLWVLEAAQNGNREAAKWLKNMK